MMNLTDDLKNALSSVVSGAGDVVGTTRDVVKKTVVQTLKAGGDVASTSVETVENVVSDGVSAASAAGVSTSQAVTGLVMGVIEDLIAVRLVTGETIRFRTIWIVFLVALPFAFLSEYVVDHPRFWKIIFRMKDEDAQPQKIEQTKNKQ